MAGILGSIFPPELQSAFHASQSDPNQPTIATQAADLLRAGESVLVRLPGTVGLELISLAVAIDFLSNRALAKPKVLVVLPTDVEVEQYLRTAARVEMEARIDRVDRSSMSSIVAMNRLFQQTDLLLISSAQFKETLRSGVFPLAEIHAVSLAIFDDYSQRGKTVHLGEELSALLSVFVRNQVSCLILEKGDAGEGLGSWSVFPNLQVINGKASRLAHQPGETRPETLRAMRRAEIIYPIHGVERLFWILLLISLILFNLEIRLQIDSFQKALGRAVFLLFRILPLFLGIFLCLGCIFLFVKIIAVLVTWNLKMRDIFVLVHCIDKGLKKTIWLFKESEAEYKEEGKKSLLGWILPRTSHLLQRVYDNLAFEEVYATEHEMERDRVAWVIRHAMGLDEDESYEYDESDEFDEEEEGEEEEGEEEAEEAEEEEEEANDDYLPGYRPVRRRGNGASANRPGLADFARADEFINSTAVIRIAIGRGQDHKLVFCDLARLPHLFIAREHYVAPDDFLSSLLLSLIYFNNPADLRLWFYCKDYEFSDDFRPFANANRQIIIRSCDPTEVQVDLESAANEMERRFLAFAACGANNITNFNQANPEDRMARWVIYLDDLAPSMQKQREAISALLARLGEKGHLAGIHLIIVTTVLNKVTVSSFLKYFPARIAFKLSTTNKSLLLFNIPDAASLKASRVLLFQQDANQAPVQLEYLVSGESDNTALLRRAWVMPVKPLQTPAPKNPEEVKAN